ITAQYAVVDVADLVVSNHLNGEINESFPQALQPRNRTTFEAVNKIAQQSLHIDFSRLNASKRTDIGAPIIGEDRVVESGNGRVMALNKAYIEGNAQTYRFNLWQLAKRFGLHPNVVERMSRPVLVRVRLTAVNRVQFAKDCNVGAGDSQSEKLAKNGRLFESVQALNTNARGATMLEAIEGATSVTQVKAKLSYILGTLELGVAKDPATMWINLAANNIKNDIANGTMRVNYWAQYSQRLVHDRSSSLSFFNKGINFWESDIIDKAIGDGLGTQPVEAEVFNGYVYAVQDLDVQVMRDGLISKDDQLQLRSLANELGPLMILTGNNLDLAAKVIFAIFGVEINGDQLDELLNPPDGPAGMAQAVPELFPPAVLEMIDSFYDGFVDTLDAPHRGKDVKNLFQKMLIDKDVFFKGRYPNAPTQELVLRIASWSKLGAVYNKVGAAYDKRPTVANRQALARVATAIDPDSKEAETLTRNLDMYFDRGVMPTASAVGMEVLATLKAADATIKSNLASSAVGRVTDMLDKQIASNAAMPRYAPIVNDRVVKGGITRFNKDSIYAKVEPLPNILDVSDQLNRLLAGNLPQTIEYMFDGFRASYYSIGGYGRPIIKFGSGSKKTMWHELAHSLEYNHPEIFKASKFLLTKRALDAKDPTFIPLNSLTDYAKYEDTEFAVNNYTFSAYAMKVYCGARMTARQCKIENLDRVEATELISVAFESLTSPEGIARLMSDKEHFALAIAAVQYLKIKRG
ncbi:MAG: hypothetical protein ACRC1W_03005, partial [Shewanella sp.]